MAFLLDITTARLFVAVAEEASIARAARRERIAALVHFAGPGVVGCVSPLWF